MAAVGLTWWKQAIGPGRWLGGTRLLGSIMEVGTDALA